MWDYLILVATLALTPGILPTLFNKEAYVPRVSSGVFTVAIAAIAIGLYGSGLPLGATANVLGSAVWGLVFVLRGRKV
ncbi:hypothetical protein LCGC14_2958930 [marine sediment metagenome]|uniref:Uncharacterized protein n=1 Tax=marine sediment metagenome TaxID=412755 RepID=A0A0F8XDP7_9ZZZZ